LIQSRKKLGWLHIRAYIKTQTIKTTNASTCKSKVSKQKKEGLHLRHRYNITLKGLKAFVHYSIAGDDL
jgi:hypothetical protein